MISVDTSIIVYALNTRMPQHEKALEFIAALHDRDDVAICELILVEVYLLIRNPAVFPRPYGAAEAVEVCTSYRDNPRWMLVGCRDVMERAWEGASAAGVARRQIIDARVALTLRAAGVTELATANVDDFGGFGFRRVWDPTSP